MVLDQGRSLRKETGARYKRQHAKKKHALGRTPTMTKVSDDLAKRTVKVRGGHKKTRLLKI